MSMCLCGKYVLTGQFDNGTRDAMSVHDMIPPFVIHTKTGCTPPSIVTQGEAGEHAE